MLILFYNVIYGSVATHLMKISRENVKLPVINRVQVMGIVSQIIAYQSATLTNSECTGLMSNVFISRHFQEYVTPL